MPVHRLHQRAGEPVATLLPDPDVSAKYSQYSHATESSLERQVIDHRRDFQNR